MARGLCSKWSASFQATVQGPSAAGPPVLTIGRLQGGVWVNFPFFVPFYYLYFAGAHYTSVHHRAGQLTQHRPPAPQREALHPPQPWGPTPSSPSPVCLPGRGRSLSPTPIWSPRTWDLPGSDFLQEIREGASLH